MKVSSSRKDSFRPSWPNGPALRIVAQMAKAVRITATVAVSRGPRRSAAHSSGRMARKPSGLVYSDKGSSGLNAADADRDGKAEHGGDVAQFARRMARSRDQAVRAHSTMTGVTTSAPAASPSHQVTQTGASLS